jgi:hypothetical protein
VSSTSSISGEDVNEPATASREPTHRNTSEEPAADTEPEEAEVGLQTTEEEFEEQMPISRSVTRQPSSKASGVDDEPHLDSAPQIRRMTRTNTFSDRRHPVRTPSPIPEELLEQLTNASSASGSDDMELERQLREKLFSPEYVQRRVTTRRHTQPVEASPESSSSPAKGIKSPPVEVQSQFTTSRRPTQLEEVDLGESNSSISSPIEVEEPLAVNAVPPEVEYMEEDFIPPAVTRRQSSAAYKAPTEQLRRQSTILPPASPSRRDTIMSEKTPAELSAELGRSPTEPQEIRAPSSRQVTRQVTRQPTQQLTRKLTVGPVRASSQYEILESVEDDANVPVVTSAQPSRVTTHQESRVELEELSQSEPEELEDYAIDSREEPQDALIEAVEQFEMGEADLATEADEHSAAVDEVSKAPESSRAEIDELKAEIAYLQELLDAVPEASSRRVSRVPTMPSRQPTVKDQDHSPSSNSDAPPTPNQPQIDPPGEQGPDSEPQHDEHAGVEQTQTFPEDEPLAAYDVGNDVGSSTPEPGVTLPEQRSNSIPPDETYFSQSPVPTVREQRSLERHPTIPTRVNTQRGSPTAERPEILKPQPTRQDTEANAEQFNPSGRRETRFDSQVDELLPRASTMQSERPRSVSVAPGIEILPPQRVPTEGLALLPKKSYKKVSSYPPGEQHPAAPAYPPRKTPTWTVPDTHTLPSRRGTDSEPRKRRLSSRGAKPKGLSPPNERSGPAEPNEDRPFPTAAPGGRGSPGGTLQRSESGAVPSRDYDEPARSGPIYARKDDYYPRLTSIVTESKNDSRRLRPAPTERPEFASNTVARQQSFRGPQQAGLDSRPRSPQEQERTPSWIQAKPSFRRASTQNGVSQSPQVQVPKERASMSDMSSQKSEPRFTPRSASVASVTHSNEGSQVSSPLGRHILRTNTEPAPIPSQAMSAQVQYPGPSRASSTQVQLPARSPTAQVDDERQSPAPSRAPSEQECNGRPFTAPSRAPSAQIKNGGQISAPSRAPSRAPSAQGQYSAPSRTASAQIHGKEQPRAPSRTSTTQVEARTQPPAPSRDSSVQGQERTESPALKRRDTAPIKKAPTRREPARRASEATNAALGDPSSPGRGSSPPAEGRQAHKRSSIARSNTEAGPNDTSIPTRRASTALGDRPARRRSSAAKPSAEAGAADARTADFPPPLKRPTTLGDGQVHKRSTVARSNTEAKIRSAISGSYTGHRDSCTNSSKRASTAGGDGTAPRTRSTTPTSPPPCTRSTTPTSPPPGRRATTRAADPRYGGRATIPQQNTPSPSAAKLGSERLSVGAGRLQSRTDAKSRRASRSYTNRYDGNNSHEAHGDTRSNAPSEASSTRKYSTPGQQTPSKRSGGFFGKRKEPQTGGSQQGANAKEADIGVRPGQQQPAAKVETRVPPQNTGYNALKGLKNKFGWGWGRS